jgi:isoamyl acetate esterase
MARHKDVQPHAPRVRLLMIWFGANDASLPGFRQHVPLSRFSENITTMVRSIRSPESPWYSPETKIFLITPPPVHVPSMREDMQPSRTFDNTRAYAEEVIKVGEAEKVPVIDAWTGVWEAARENKEAVKTFLTDGLHLSKAGYEVSINSQIEFWYGDTRPQVVFGALEKAIIQQYPELYHLNLPSIFPYSDYFHGHTLEEFKAENWLDGRRR